MEVQKNSVHSAQHTPSSESFQVYETWNIDRKVILEPVTVAERSKAWTVFARSEAEIVDSNPAQDMDVSYVYMFFLSLCCPVFR
jgi:endo-1,4-beta-D-glucanase Y